MECKYCKKEINSEAIICFHCGKYQKWWRRRYSLPITLLSAIISGISCCLFYYTAKDNEQLTVLKIQTELHYYYNNWRDYIRNADIDLDRSDDKYIDSCLTNPKSQKIIMKYWRDVCYNEYITINEFGFGISKKYWKIYSVMIKNAINDRQMLKKALFLYKQEHSTGQPNSHKPNEYERRYISALEKIENDNSLLQ